MIEKVGLDESEKRDDPWYIGDPWYTGDPGTEDTQGRGSGGDIYCYSPVASNEALVSRSAEKRLKRSTSAARLSASATVTTAV